MRTVLDPNVIISALLSSTGAPAGVVRAWLEGEFELLVSPMLLAELKRALDYPKLRQRIQETEATELLEWLAREATVVPDPEGVPSVRSADPGDDYLLALVEDTGAALISGDSHLLVLGEKMPIVSPRRFLGALGRD